MPAARTWHASTRPREFRPAARASASPHASRTVSPCEEAPLGLTAWFKPGWKACGWSMWCPTLTHAGLQHGRRGRGWGRAHHGSHHARCQLPVRLDPLHKVRVITPILGHTLAHPARAGCAAVAPVHHPAEPQRAPHSVRHVACTMQHAPHSVRHAACATAPGLPRLLVSDHLDAGVRDAVEAKHGRHTVAQPGGRALHHHLRGRRARLVCALAWACSAHLQMLQLGAPASPSLSARPP